ncbi:MAG: hypothetical protein QS721_04820 [Candidatus Endonucleobacter sp. (ex Gigantidas childressi)]|nr:hypothetical protein [Candidatus Endonucleobacter sp. (ex Gigantidas childressi)]
MINNDNQHKQWVRLVFIYEVAFVLIYAMLIITGYREFIIWSQVGDLLFESSFHERSNTVLKLFADKSFHATRIALIYPIFQLSDILNINVLTLYSLTVLILLVLMYKIILSILRSYSVAHLAFFILVFLLILSLFMHGRIVFAMFGNALILYVLFTRIHFPRKMNFMKLVIYLMIALWFCSVSSGTFTVAVGAIIIFCSLRMLIGWPYIQRRFLILFVVLIALLILMSPILLQMINKNLDYYDGSLISMLNHGFGKYVLDYFYVTGVLLFIASFLFVKFICFLKRNKEFILPLSMIIASLAIGLFGLSSLASGLPAYILFIYMYLNKNNLKVS